MLFIVTVPICSATSEKNLKENTFRLFSIFKYDNLLLLVHNYSILLIISHSNGTQSVLVGHWVVGVNCTLDFG